VPQSRTAGLPTFPSYTATVGTAGAESYIYYVIYVYTYQVGNVTFRDESAPFALNVLSAATPPNNTLNGLTALSNSLTTSYDLSSITKEIYRTVSGGKIGYFVASIPNATTSYLDTTPDATIQLNQSLPFTTGTKPYNQPPNAKFITIMNGRAYYAYTRDPVTLEEFPTRVYQSIQDDPDSVPEEFFIEVRDEIRGISSVSDRVIVFGKSKVYRLDGYFDEFGRQGITYEEISKITGCVSQNSIVQTDMGIFFAGSSGFFFTDGYKFEKISDSINERYKQIVEDEDRTNLICGCFDSLTMRVYWALPSDSGIGENDTIYVLDLRQGVKTTSTFTKWSNGSYFKPSAISMFKNELIRCDQRGYVFRHNDVFSNDPRIDIKKPFLDWGTATIVYNIVSPHMDFGIPQVRKWVSRILIAFKNLSNLSVQIYSINDAKATENPLKEIRYRSLLTWGDPDPIWGDASLIWNDTSLTEQYRRFPANGLRCSYKQIRITNAYTIIDRSDDISTCDLDTGTLVATLTDPLMEWSPDLLDYDLVIQPTGVTDPYDYPITLPILQRIDNLNILVSDPDNQIANFPGPVYGFSDCKWYIKGKAKYEYMNLISFVVYYAPIGASQKTFQDAIADSGENTP